MNLSQDLYQACRSLRSKPLYAAAVVLLMALGIGAATAGFSAVNGLLWIRYPYPDADRLVVPVSVRTASGGRSNVTYADYTDWRAMRDVFTSVAVHSTRELDLTGAGEPETLEVGLVSGDYFQTLGLKPLLGRSFRPDDNRPGAPVTALLGHGLWQRRFGSARDVVGRTVRLSDRPVVIVGVMPAEASYQTTTALWVTLPTDPTSRSNTRRDNMVWGGIARLAPGVSIEQARVRVKALAARLERDEAATRKGWTNDLIPLRRVAIPEAARRTTVLLFGAVVSLLLVACVNVAGLQLARATTRQREIAVRMALGASRSRLVSQLLAESLMLALAGGAAGVALAHMTLRMVPALVPEGVLPPGASALGVDGSVLAFAVAAACGSAVLFGLLPAWLATSARAEEAIRSNSGAVLQRKTQRARSLLVTAEVALSFALLVGAGLLVKSLVRLYGADTGLQASRVLTAGLRTPQGRYNSEAAVRDFYARAMERIRAIPGVESAAAVSLVPIGGPGLQLSRAFLPEGAPEPPAGPEFNGEWSVVTPSYFETMKISVVKGRPFTDHDTAASTPVAIISESMAHQVFGDRDPIGQRIRSWRDENRLREIVGVARDVRYFGVSDVGRPLVYVPHQQDMWPGMRVVIRTAGDPLAATKLVRQAIASIDPDVPLAGVAAMEQYRLESMALPRLAAALLSGLSLMALVLAAVGVLGLTSYTVSMRTREFGLRLALGAAPSALIRLVLGHAVVLTAIGIVLGGAASYGWARLLQSLLFEVTATDVGTFVSMGAVMAGVAMLASYVPARRAARVDPALTLRAE